jgi:hypothetical protein
MTGGLGKSVAGGAWVRGAGGARAEGAEDAGGTGGGEPAGGVGAVRTGEVGGGADGAGDDWLEGATSGGVDTVEGARTGGGVEATIGAGIEDRGRGEEKPGGGDWGGGRRAGAPNGGARGAGEPAPRAAKPGGGILDARELERSAGAGGATPPGVPAGEKLTGRVSLSVRKSSSCAGGEGRRWEKGKVVSSKMTWREMMTRLVSRVWHR